MTASPLRSPRSIIVWLPLLVPRATGIQRAIPSKAINTPVNPLRLKIDWVGTAKTFSYFAKTRLACVIEPAKNAWLTSVLSLTSTVPVWVRSSRALDVLWAICRLQSDYHPIFVELFPNASAYFISSLSRFSFVYIKRKYDTKIN